MAIPLAVEDVRVAREVLDLMGELPTGSREDHLFRRVYKDINGSLHEAAIQADFTWPIHLPVDVLLRLWLKFQSQEYQVEVTFCPQKLTFVSYA